MNSNDSTIWFHGTSQKSLDDQISEHGEYIGSMTPGSYGRGMVRKGIYLAENTAAMPMTCAIETARRYDSSPILMISSSEIIRNRIRLGNTCWKIYCGWPPGMYVTLDVPIVDINDDFGYDEDRFKDELRKLFETQTLFTPPTNFDWNNVTNYWDW